MDPGSYWSVIIVEPVEDIKPSDSKPRVSITSIIRYAIQVITDFETEKAKPDLKFESIKVEKQEGKQTAKIAIANNGNLYCKPTASIEIYNRKTGEKVGTYSSLTMGLLPNTSKTFYIDISKVPPDKYKAAIIAADEEENAFALNVELEVKMSRTWTLFIIISLFPVFYFSQEQSNRLISKKDSLMRGMSTSIPFTLENNSDEAKTYDISITTSSSSINPILAKGEFQILPHETSVYLVPLRVGTETGQGIYSVIMNVTDRHNGISFTKNSKIIVSGHRNLLVTALNTPEFVRAGETIRASFLLKNNGNVTESIVLESKNAIVDNETSLVLEPNESKTITIHKVTNPELAQNEFQNLNLSVHSKGNPKENQEVYVSTQVISAKNLLRKIFITGFLLLSHYLLLACRIWECIMMVFRRNLW